MLIKKWKTNEFLCFKLETGGKFISWLYFIFFCLIMVLSLLGIVFVFVDCNNMQPLNDLFPESLKSCTIIKIITATVSVLLIILSLLTCIVFKKCINGINELDHTKMRSGVILCAIINVMLVMIDIYGIFVSFRLLDIVDIALTITVCVYFYVCLRSLYEKIQLKNEHKNIWIEKEADPMRTA